MTKAMDLCYICEVISIKSKVKAKTKSITSNLVLRKAVSSIGDYPRVGSDGKYHFHHHHLKGPVESLLQIARKTFETILSCRNVMHRNCCTWSLSGAS